jgi:hypothetical protein
MREFMLIKRHISGTARTEEVPFDVKAENSRSRRPHQGLHPTIP